MERNEEERAAWRASASNLPTESLVFIDECGSNCALRRMTTLALKGKRARASVPHNRDKNTTLIAALSLDGIGATLILEGSVNTTAFKLYAEQILAPVSMPGRSWSWTISRHRKAHESGRLARRKAVSFSSFPGIRLLSSSSKRRSPGSKHRCDEQEPELEKPGRSYGISVIYKRSSRSRGVSAWMVSALRISSS